MSHMYVCGCRINKWVEVLPALSALAVNSILFCRLFKIHLLVVGLRSAPKNTFLLVLLCEGCLFLISTWHKGVG